MYGYPKIDYDQDICCTECGKVINEDLLWFTNYAFDPICSVCHDAEVDAEEDAESDWYSMSAGEYLEECFDRAEGEYADQCRDLEIDRELTGW